MFTIPELRALDEHSDELAVRRLTLMFRRLPVPGAAAERERLARLYLKISNALLLETIRQKGSAARRTLADLKKILVHLLRGEGGLVGRASARRDVQAEMMAG
jgi:hypothetical protein